MNNLTLNWQGYLWILCLYFRGFKNLIIMFGFGKKEQKTKENTEANSPNDGTYYRSKKSGRPPDAKKVYEKVRARPPDAQDRQNTNSNNEVDCLN